MSDGHISHGQNEAIFEYNEKLKLKIRKINISTLIVK